MYLHVYIHRENRSVCVCVCSEPCTNPLGNCKLGNITVEKLHHNVYVGNFIATVQYSDTVYSRTGDKIAELAYFVAVQQFVLTSTLTHPPTHTHTHTHTNTASWWLAWPVLYLRSAVQVWQAGLRQLACGQSGSCDCPVILMWSNDSFVTFSPALIVPLVFKF